MNDENDWTDDPTFAAGDDRSLDERIADMKKREANQAPPYFLPLLGGFILWAVAGLWVQHKINYPDAFGYSDKTCGVRGCWVVDLIHSPVLLERPTGYALLLFGWYVSMAVAVAAILIHAAMRKPHRKYLIPVIIVLLCFAYLATDPTLQRATWNS